MLIFITLLLIPYFSLVSSSSCSPHHPARHFFISHFLLLHCCIIPLFPHLGTLFLFLFLSLLGYSHSIHFFTFASPRCITLTYFPPPHPPLVHTHSLFSINPLILFIFHFFHLEHQIPFFWDGRVGLFFSGVIWSLANFILFTLVFLIFIRIPRYKFFPSSFREGVRAGWRERDGGGEGWILRGI